MGIVNNIYKMLFNEQYKAQFCCEYVGSDSKNILLKKLMRRWLEKRHKIIIGLNTRVGRGIFLPHPQNIVIGEGVVIGDNVVIYQDVTIGVKDRNSIDLKKYPNIGNNVCIYPGAKVIGAIRINDGTIIAANAVMMQDSVKDGIYGGIPAKLLKMNVNME